MEHRRRVRDARREGEIEASLDAMLSFQDFGLVVGLKAWKNNTDKVEILKSVASCSLTFIGITYLSHRLWPTKDIYEVQDALDANHALSLSDNRSVTYATIPTLDLLSLQEFTLPVSVRAP